MADKGPYICLDTFLFQKNDLVKFIFILEKKMLLNFNEFFKWIWIRMLLVHHLIKKDIKYEMKYVV